MDKADIKIFIEQKEEFNERGFDEVSFMISTNPENLLNL